MLSPHGDQIGPLGRRGDQIRPIGRAADSRLRGQMAAGTVAAPMRLLHASIAYLTPLFTAVAITALAPWGRF